MNSRGARDLSALLDDLVDNRFLLPSSNTRSTRASAPIVDVSDDEDEDFIRQSRPTAARRKKINNLVAAAPLASNDALDADEEVPVETPPPENHTRFFFHNIHGTKLDDIQVRLTEKRDAGVSVYALCETKHNLDRLQYLQDATGQFALFASERDEDAALQRYVNKHCKSELALLQRQGPPLSPQEKEAAHTKILQTKNRFAAKSTGGDGILVYVDKEMFPAAREISKSVFHIELQLTDGEHPTNLFVIHAPSHSPSANNEFFRDEIRPKLESLQGHPYMLLGDMNALVDSGKDRSPAKANLPKKEFASLVSDLQLTDIGRYVARKAHSSPQWTFTKGTASGCYTVRLDYAIANANWMERHESENLSLYVEPLIKDHAELTLTFALAREPRAPKQKRTIFKRDLSDEQVEILQDSLSRVTEEDLAEDAVSSVNAVLSAFQHDHLKINLPPPNPFLTKEQREARHALNSLLSLRRFERAIHNPPADYSDLRVFNGGDRHKTPLQKAAKVLEHLHHNFQDLVPIVPPNNGIGVAQVVARWEFQQALNVKIDAASKRYRDETKRALKAKIKQNIERMQKRHTQSVETHREINGRTESHA